MFRVQGLGFRVQGQGSGFSVQGLGFRVKVFWHLHLAAALIIGLRREIAGLAR